MAEYLGIDMVTESDLLDIARMAVAVPTPPGWQQLDNADGFAVFRYGWPTFKSGSNFVVFKLALISTLPLESSHSAKVVTTQCW